MNDLEGSRALVLGGAGFIGSAVVRRLRAARTEVVVFDNFLHGRRAHLAGLGEGVRVVEGDLRDLPALHETLSDARPDFVLNCSGDTYVPSAYELPERFLSINALGTLHALQAVKARGVARMVQLSSAEVYGRAGAQPLSEDAALRPVNTYAVTKLAADCLCSTFFVEHSAPVVVARIFNAYGPRETHPYVVPEIITQLRRGTSAVELGNIAATRDLTYVDDTARAVVALLASDVPQGAVVNVGSNNAHSIEALVGMIAELAGVPEVRIRQDPRRLRARDIDAFRCDNSRLRELTGWAPEIDIHTGLKKTLEWYDEHGGRWCWEDDSADVRAWSAPGAEGQTRSELLDQTG